MFGRIESGKCPYCNTEYQDILGITSYVQIKEKNKSNNKMYRFHVCDNCGKQFLVDDEGNTKQITSDMKFKNAGEICY